MGAFWTLFPLVVLFTLVAGGAYFGYQIYLWSNELADRGRNHMEKKNVVFTKDGVKVGVKQLSEEDYAARQQNLLVRTWNLSSFPAYKSWLWKPESPSSPATGAKSGGASPSSAGSRSRSSSSSQFPKSSSAERDRAGSGTGYLAVNHGSGLRPPLGRKGSSSSPGAFPE